MYQRPSRFWKINLIIMQILFNFPYFKQNIYFSIQYQFRNQIHLSMVAEFLQAFSLFPYSKLWNFAGKSDVNNNTGVIISIGIYILMAVLFFVNLTDVIQMKTIASTTSYASASFQNIINNDFIAANITTYQNDPVELPYMLAFQLDPHLTITGHVSGSLQTCTPGHFSTLPDIDRLFTRFNMSKWKCFPLNSHMYVTQENIPGGQDQSYYQFYVDLVTPGVSIGYIFSIYSLNSYPNPSNGTQWTIELSKRTLTYSLYGNSYYTFFLNQNILNSDISIMPWSNMVTKNGYCLDDVYTLANTYFATLYMDFYRSKKTFIYTQTFSKLLDIFAYLGGIFVTIVGFFIFMEAFGEAVFQMHFAFRYFKEKEAKGYNILSYCKNMIYDFLTAINRKPDWKLYQKRNQIKEAVGELLDVLYLLKRIEFLEKAINVLLDKHQIKGLHLLENFTSENILKNSEEHHFKKKLLLSMVHQLALQEEIKGNKNNMNCKNKIVNCQISDEINQYSRSQVFTLEHRVNNRAFSNILARMEGKVQPQPDSGMNLAKGQVERDVSIGILDSFDVNQGDLEKGQLFDQDEIMQNIRDLKRLMNEGTDMMRGDEKSKKIVGLLNQSLKKNLGELIGEYESKRIRATAINEKFE